MEKNIKERVVMYNVNEEERNLIKNIFLALKIDVNFIEAENEEAVIASNLVSFIFFCNSTIGIGINDINKVISHCILFNGTNLNILANVGTMTTIVCINTPKIKLL